MLTMVSDTAMTERGSNEKIMDVPSIDFNISKEEQPGAPSLMLMSFHSVDFVDPSSHSRLLVMKSIYALLFTKL